jgi:hypothetical protein
MITIGDEWFLLFRNLKICPMFVLNDIGNRKLGRLLVEMNSQADNDERISVGASKESAK